MITREEQAGRLYNDGSKAVKAGGDELHSLAMHLIQMINGTEMPKFRGPLWPLRHVPPDGKVIELDRFIDYLLKPPRDGLHLPSLHFLKQILQATPALGDQHDGERALALVRAELAKEHIDFDAQARDEGVRLHGERAALATSAEAGAKGGRGNKAIDNIKSFGGTSAAYLAARLQRDFPEIAKGLAKGKFKSVRAAAIEAGIVKPGISQSFARELGRQVDELEIENAKLRAAMEQLLKHEDVLGEALAEIIRCALE
jgi:hypothetical protein